MPAAKKAGLVKARELIAREQERLSGVPVELQVVDTAHARSPEVVQFCIAHLSGGGTWNELRRKLGLGPSHLDNRWRVIRQVVTEGLMPETEEEALQAQSSMRTYLISKIENFLEDVENKLLADGNAMTDHYYMRMRLDSLKVLLQENNESFNSYMNVKKLKAMEKVNRGVSILVQNNYHIARPDKKEDVKELLTKTQKLLEKK